MQGLNDQGQLGRQPTFPRPFSSDTIVECMLCQPADFVSGICDARLAAAGNAHTLVTSTSNRTSGGGDSTGPTTSGSKHVLWAWGSNTNGQTGMPHHDGDAHNHSSSSCASQPKTISENKNVLLPHVVLLPPDTSTSAPSPKANGKPFVASSLGGMTILDNPHIPIHMAPSDEALFS
jgi:hypothetical protein